MTTTTAKRSANMRAIRSKDTEPELRVRRLAHAMGLRFRLHRSDLPGRPDVVFPGRRVVLFVHGCFWHGHGCKRGGTGPKSNTSYWLPKIERNRARDSANKEALENLGWRVSVIWECDLTSDEAVKERILETVDSSD